MAKYTYQRYFIMTLLLAAPSCEVQEKQRGASSWSEVMLEKALFTSSCQVHESIKKVNPLWGINIGVIQIKKQIADIFWMKPVIPQSARNSGTVYCFLEQVVNDMIFASPWFIKNTKIWSNAFRDQEKPF